MSAANEAKVSVELPADAVAVTCTAPVNIAVIKYWGKRDTKLILPINSSLSGTIDQGTMKSQTTAIASRSYDRDVMILNGEEEAFSSRIQAVLDAVRARAGDWVDEATGKVLVAKADWPQYRLRIVSHNNFPTAAGLASSASGLACLTKCLAELHCVKEQFEGELSMIARQGSGSACRSMYGGWVKWVMGERADGGDSLAVQVAPEAHWPEMRVLILVVSAGPKGTSSTSGMQATVETSPLVAHRAAEVVEPRMRAMEDAIMRRDFEQFGQLTIKDSNQFHATCLDTYPPIFYLNDTSRHIIRVCHAVNAAAGRVVAAYTFDAGPNAVVYCLDKDMDALLRTFLAYFMPDEHAAAPAAFLTDPLAIARGGLETFRDDSLVGEDVVPRVASPAHPVRRIIVSKIGEGAKLVERQHSFAQ